MKSCIATPVLHDFIYHELQTSVPSLDSGVFAELTRVAESFLNNSIPLFAAVEIFNNYSVPVTLISKLARIMEVGADPIPPSGNRNFYSTRKMKNVDNIARKRAVSWSGDEDIRLITAISRFGCRDWRLIAAFVGSGRTSSQCNQRWTRALNPQISHRPWTKEEDDYLIQAVNENGECGWRKIAGNFNGRTDLQCRHRYIQLKKNICSFFNGYLKDCPNPSDQTSDEKEKVQSTKNLLAKNINNLTEPRIPSTTDNQDYLKTGQVYDDTNCLRKEINEEGNDLSKYPFMPLFTSIPANESFLNFNCQELPPLIIKNTFGSVRL